MEEAAGKNRTPFQEARLEYWDTYVDSICTALEEGKDQKIGPYTANLKHLERMDIYWRDKSLLVLASEKDIS